MSGILGLTSGKTFDDEGFYSLNNRRQVLHNFPNGRSPLTGLLSLMEDENTDNPQFGWFEKRFGDIRTEAATNAGNGCISPQGSNTALASPADLDSGTIYRFSVVDASCLKASHQLWFKDVPVTGGTAQLYGTVVDIISPTLIEMRMTVTVAAVINTTVPASSIVGNDVQCIGTANAEGAKSTGSRFIVPINPSNLTQIFRNSIYFTATSLKIPANFDKTGIYKERSKDASLDHMTGIEKAFLWGNRNIQYVTHSVTGEQVPVRTTGGIFWYLQEYEKAGGGQFGYRPGGALLTDNNDDDKRIITVANGTTTKAEFMTWVERVFRRTNNKAFEKLVLCGNGVMAAINNLIELGVVTTNKGMKSEDTYGMAITSIETIFGTLHFKSHPLFNEDPTHRYTALITDVGELRYRALNDRDTTLLGNRQDNDEDGRKDEWLTECGLECRFPESHMIIYNLQEITVS